MSTFIEDLKAEVKELEKHGLENSLVVVNAFLDNPDKRMFIAISKLVNALAAEIEKLTANGVTDLLNGDDRNHTNKIIRDYLGTYDDFLLTTLSTQNDNKNFIFKKQGERKELVYSFLDLSVFESLQSIAKVNIKKKSDDLYAYTQ